MSQTQSPLRRYVDESKSKGYVIVGTDLFEDSRREAERQLISLLKPGQRRIHFRSENDSRRRQILSAIAKIPAEISIWHTNETHEKQARQECMVAMVRDARMRGVREICIERDATSEAADRSVIAGLLKLESGIELRYRHENPAKEPLLWVSDAIAWCFSRGGEWKKRSRELGVRTHALR